MPIPDALKPLYAEASAGDEAAINALADRLSDLGAIAIAAVLSHRLSLPSADKPIWQILGKRRVSERLQRTLAKMFPHPIHVPLTRRDQPLLSQHALLTDVTSWSRKAILELYDVGKVTLQELRELLWDYGLTLAGDKPPTADR